jgi:hypothetical protein
MVRLEVRITRLQIDVTVPAGATTGTVSVPTADAIDEVTENFSIALELLRLRVPLSTITMPLLWQRSPASATEGSDVVFNFTLATLLISLLPILLY